MDLTCDKNDGRVISNFIIQCLENKDITIYGDGSQTRSFCYVDDLVLGIYKLMNLESNHETLRPVNLGNPNELSIKEIAIKIKNLTNSESKIIYEELPKDDPMKRKPCIEKAKRLLDWKPKISLEEGLIKTIDYFKNLKYNIKK